MKIRKLVLPKKNKQIRNEKLYSRRENKSRAENVLDIAVAHRQCENVAEIS